MKTIKVVVRKSNELTAFSVDAADNAQARHFVKITMPDCYLVSMKEIAWKLDIHFDFQTCANTVSIHRHNAARRQRGCVGLPVMELS